MRILAQVPEDRVRLREPASILEFEYRNAAIRILGQEIGFARSPVMKPVILEREFYAELSRGESDFVAIARTSASDEARACKDSSSVKESMATGNPGQSHR